MSHVALRWRAAVWRDAPARASRQPPVVTRPPLRPGRRVGAGGVEELDVAGDDLELLAAAVVGVPLGVVQAAFDGDLAALGQVLGARVGLAAEHGDVDVVGALVLAVLAGALDGEAQAGDLGPPLVVRSLDVGGEPAGEC